MIERSRVILIGSILLFALAAVFIYGIQTTEVATPSSRGGNQTKLAIELTRYVRSMADDNHIPRDGTFLYERIRGVRENALCSDYAPVLKRMIKRLKLGDARVLNISFNPNGWDMHTLVEYFDEKQKEWIILDPTFAMYVRRKKDNGFASARDIQQATMNRDWSGLEFVTLNGAKYQYYLDYPLLFLNLHGEKKPWKAQATSLLPYLENAPLPARERRGWYILQYVGKDASDEGAIDASVEVNGSARSLVLDGIGRTSKVFGATSISVPEALHKEIVAYNPKRFVFTSE